MLCVLKGGFSSDFLGVYLIGKVFLRLLLSLGHWLEFTLLVPLVDLTWSHNLVMWIVKEFVPMCQPSCQSWESEENGEHLGWDAQSLVDDSGVEVDVWIQLLGNEVFVSECNLFKLHSNIDKWLSSDNIENLF